MCAGPASGAANLGLELDEAGAADQMAPQYVGQPGETTGSKSGE